MGEDWKLIYDEFGGEGWDWWAMELYYSPSKRRYFWQEDSGCSCNSFGDEGQAEDEGWWNNGTREDVKRHFRGNQDALIAINAFKENK